MDRCDSCSFVDVPGHVPMGRDERAVVDRHNDQDLTFVLADLVAAADELVTMHGAMNKLRDIDRGLEAG